MKIYLNLDGLLLVDNKVHLNKIKIENIKGIITVTTDVINKKRLNLTNSILNYNMEMYNILYRIHWDFKYQTFASNFILIECEINFEILEDLLKTEIQKHIYLDYDLDALKKACPINYFFPNKDETVFQLYRGINNDDINIEIQAINNFIKSLNNEPENIFKYEYLFYSLGTLAQIDRDSLEIIKDKKICHIETSNTNNNKLIDKFNNFITYWNKYHDRTELCEKLNEIQDLLINTYLKYDEKIEGIKYFSFIGEMIYSSKTIAENIVFRSSDFDNLNLLRSNKMKLSYIVNLKRNASMEFIKTVINILTIRISKGQFFNLNLLFQSFTNYNLSRNILNEFNKTIISFKDIEEFTFLFQNIDFWTIDLSEIIINIPANYLNVIGNPEFMCKAVCVPFNPNIRANLYIKTNLGAAFIEFLSYEEAIKNQYNCFIYQLKWILPQ